MPKRFISLVQSHLHQISEKNGFFAMLCTGPFSARLMRKTACSLHGLRRWEFESELTPQVHRPAHGRILGTTTCRMMALWEAAVVGLTDHWATKLISGLVVFQ